MTLKYHQISLKDTFSNCQDMFLDDAPSFFHILSEHFDLEQFIPSAFFSAFTKASVENVPIPYRVSFLSLSFRRSFLSQRIPFSFSFFF